MLNQFDQPWSPKLEKKDDPVVKCKKCSCEWFEQFAVRRYRSDHTVILSQHVPPAGLEEFIILRCIKCSELHAPNVSIQAHDNVTKLYNSMMDQLEAP